MYVISFPVTSVQQTNTFSEHLLQYSNTQTTTNGSLILIMLHAAWDIVGHIQDPTLT
jgi:hypothetical protein